MHDVFDGGGRQFATGVIIDDVNRFLYPLSGWVKFVPDGPPRGRKPNLNRLAAVLLGHAWHVGCLSMTPGRADRALVPLLDFSDQRAVRRARKEKVKNGKISGNRLMVWRCAGGGCAILLDESATVEFTDDEMRCTGPAWVWEYGRQEATYQKKWRVEGTLPTSGNDPVMLADMKRILVKGGDIN
ncbi:MAG: hypothetical protein P9E88_07765 [Candidatus Competibacter sp.]|nr:hypothetical protein [Candidatus Competibacter sp.]MDG4561171.1 hypothetical protein [Candidatus Competibacter sp.]